MKQSSIEWLHINNETICEMLLLDKIPKSTYEQLINCFSMNLEQAKAMHKEEIIQTVNTYSITSGEVDSVLKKYNLSTPAEDYYNKTFITK